MIKAPVMQGLIRRRLLVNFRVDPDVIQRHVPAPFKPKLHNGYAIAGICLIRLEQMRPKGLGIPVGLASENAAHRVAVAWTDAQGEMQEGVFIPRRDSDSLANHLVGGLLFPGEHHRARFDVEHAGDCISLQMQSQDGAVAVAVRGRAADRLPETSVFTSLEEASDFFERGAVGYSACAGGGHFDGLRLKTAGWSVRPLFVEHVASSYFADSNLFPNGSVAFDCALLMENTAHEWQPLAPMGLAHSGG